MEHVRHQALSHQPNLIISLSFSRLELKAGEKSRSGRRTVAKCLPLYPSDEDKGVIRIDGLVRNNAGLAIGDTVIVGKIKVALEDMIIVAPLEAVPHFDERYLADSLDSVSMIKGDNIIVPYFGGRL